MCGYYNYIHICGLKPQSIHRWRQSDCASMALNYYQNDMNFLKPEIHQQLSDDYTSGYCVAEFPVLYYFVAIIYKIFGYHDFIFRFVNTLIFLLGLYALFRALKNVLSDTFWSIFGSLLIFTCPFLVFYVCNYLTDTTALSVVFIGWMFFFNFIKKRKDSTLYFAVFFFTLASLLKISAAFSLISIGLIFLIEFFDFSKYNGDKKIFHKKFLFIIPFVLSVIVILAWYLFSIKYNEDHKSVYFLTKPWPIWNVARFGNNKTIVEAYDKLIENWFDDYFHILVLYFFLITFIFNLIFIKKANKFLLTITLFLFVGSVCYSLLWFGALSYHDYYMTNIIILPVFSMITFFETLRRFKPKIYNSFVAKIIFLLIFLISVNYARGRVFARYNGWRNDYNVNKTLHEITPYLRQIGISRYDKVISIPDETVNLSLYLMNQPGWTMFWVHDKERFDLAIKKGAKYLIVNGNISYNADFLMDYLNDSVGYFNGVMIYKLSEVNYPRINKAPASIFCDAEQTTKDGNSYITKTGEKILYGKASQSQTKAYSGIYSDKLDGNTKYGMTYVCNNVHVGDRFNISVMRWSEKKNGVIIASGNDAAEFYVLGSSIAKEMPNGWDSISTKFIVGKKLSSDQLNIYLMNNGNDDVYFDDLLIEKY